ncbi:MAG TPA: serine/threonine protein kinase, partial [Oceanospirillales bacterium]|nr:serine/threonine protein kinase [Oceanospirillales bacterium]
MQNTQVNQLLRKALLLETNQRTEFLNQIEDGELKDKLTLLLSDDTALTNFVIKTSQGSIPLTQLQIKDLKTGDKINHFIIVKLLAKGGMGSVYLAYDDKLKRNVAIKTIRSEYLKDNSTQQRFKQEAQILSQINHPSICQIYDYIDYEDGDMLVLELVNGITLSDIDLSDKDKLDVFIQIASALEVAHKKGVIHRDLKPDNIMCAADNSIKVLDFGIAKSTAAIDITIDKNDIKAAMGQKPLTKMGSLMGTLLYMSPEQAEGKEVTKASDIYSLGIIMQELLTGVTTYDLNNTKDLKQQVIAAEKINDDLIPKKYQKLIKALTQKEPSDRPSAAAVVKSLKDIQDIPKRRLKKMAIAALIILSVLGFSKYTYDLKQQTHAAQQARIAAELAQQKAEQSQQESEKVTDFLESLFLVSDPFANAGEEITARQMLDEGSKKIDEELTDQPRILFRLKATIGEIYTQLG